MNRVYRSENNGYRPQLEGRWEGREDLDERVRMRGRRDEMEEDWSHGRGPEYRGEPGYGGHIERRFGEGRLGFGGSNEGRFGREWEGHRDERILGERAGRFFERIKRKLTGPKNYQRSDERIREDLCDHLAISEWLDVSDVEVQVTAAEVTLIGTVPVRRMKHQIEDMADSTFGVKEVHNQLRIERESENRETTTSTTRTNPRERTPRA